MSNMPDSPAAVSTMDTSSGSRGHGPSNGVDEHDDGLSRIREFSFEHLDREDHVVSAYQRSFAQGYDNFGNLAFGTHDRNGCIGGIVCKGVFPLGDQFHKRIAGHVAGGSHRAIAKEDGVTKWPILE
jgi:hypothetical protein